MPDIGATLREARMRARIDISEIEAETKIRAKYLRALENEEWNLLPGPTFVKSFLRTYAEALGLDAKLLLEEYKLRHERPSEHDLQPIVPRSSAQRRREPRGGPPVGIVIAALVVALLAVLYLLGRGADDDGDPVTQARTTQTERSDAGAPTSGTRTTRSSTRGSGSSSSSRSSRIVRLRIVATGPVYVCLTGRGQGRLLDGATISPDTPSRTFRSSRFEVTLGNGSARLVIDGRTRDVPEVTDGIGYVITKRNGRVQRSVLPEGRRPSCA
ncbi:RodZ family helix-turn-helix domain-containing protein [Conexibacter sp. SYSU D00693]|uniref:helix-turn-helix domain-containing protein n=1 Tax=Conexibacter sp. SYSU D00693 TaxID=2812560 RepID=UPI00196AB5E7|nr:helix-turn-helix domain-containing protein [Conexibacter sp. SYSU D00693]